MIYLQTHLKAYLKYRFIAIIVVIALLMGLLWVEVPNPAIKQSNIKTSQTPKPNNTPSVIKASKANNSFYKVTKVIDGDTVNMEKDGKSENIRLIGIDTPETVDPRKPVQCFGKEASSKAREILMGKRVALEEDPTQGDRDKYGRLLRFVFLDDGTNFNKFMIDEGYAYEYTYQNNPYKYQAEFKNVEKVARESKKGLWADGACSSPTNEPTQTEQVPNIQPSQSESDITDTSIYMCDCAKSCTKIYSCNEAHFQLKNCGCNERDADGDGVPCETLCN